MINLDLSKYGCADYGCDMRNSCARFQNRSAYQWQAQRLRPGWEYRSWPCDLYIAIDSDTPNAEDPTTS